MLASNITDTEVHAMPLKQYVSYSQTIVVILRFHVFKVFCLKSKIFIVMFLIPVL